MRRPPPLSACPVFPITTSIIALAVIACWRSWSGADIDLFLPGGEDWWLQPWRFVAPVLFHGDVIHLLFNVYWFWVFGTCLEMEYGPAKNLGLFLLFSVGTVAAEHAVLHNAIGLSGVVYGQFGLLWVLSGRDRRFHDAVDRQTVQLMVGWFFLCIVLSVLRIWPVANIAHGVGCVLGVLLGWTISGRNAMRRIGSGAALVAVLVLSVMGATVVRPWVNFSGEVGHDFAYRGYRALVADDPERALPLLERAVAANPNVAGWWFNLGIAYESLHRQDDAIRAYQRAAKLDPRNPKYKMIMWGAKLQTKDEDNESPPDLPPSDSEHPQL